MILAIIIIAGTASGIVFLSKIQWFKSKK